MAIRTPVVKKPHIDPKEVVRDPLGGLSGADRDAYTALNNLFKQYGLESLSGKILEFLKSGYSEDTISILLQDTNEYKQRFAANDARKKAGLPVLSPAEYISTERAYRQLMQQAGLPVGFYDSPSDFRKWLENDTSPTELKGRLDVAQDYLNNADANTKAYFKNFYSDGDMLAYALDPKRAQPLIEQKYRAAQIGGAAQNQGIGIAADTASQLAQLGVTGQQARQGFGFIAQEQGTATKLSSIYSDGVNQDDIVQEVFADNADAAGRRAKLGQKERSTFSGSGALGKTSLGTNTGGQF